MSEHTPGPWSVEDASAIHARKRDIWIETAAKRLAGVDTDWGTGSPHTIPHNEALANAHLIAAAPDLLETLEYARGIVAMELGEESAHLRPLDAAIAKAKGEQ